MVRADLLLVEKGLSKSRTHAQKAIAAGRVEYKLAGQWQSLSKPSVKLEEATELRIAGDDSDRYVSRGGLKLEAAINQFAIPIEDKLCLDVGQSTGGFTDCLLQANAKLVVGVDVGRDQLDQTLRSNSRVVCYEGINARDLPAEKLLSHTEEQGFDVAVMDVSFISQSKILPSLTPLIKQNGYLISLVKPQFEVGKEGIGKGGIVKDAALYHQVEHRIKQQVESLGLTTQAYIDSPIKGGDGNREFLLIAKNSR
ncbi:TlyA family RNA methyltransferase [Maricurvus nonylphenolicus]|uniref:TlyA family RNA methyltransferase n=1 Tax=Maricurvus nonylphenolicus TaxID=1008307 RepID=UPI0036F2E88E